MHKALYERTTFQKRRMIFTEVIAKTSVNLLLSQCESLEKVTGISKKWIFVHL